LQPKNLYAVWGISPEQQAVGHYRMELGVVDHFQGIIVTNGLTDLTA